jgi:hypothetical protein
MIHILDRMEEDGRFHHTTENIAQFKHDELLAARIFYLIFLDHG